MKLSTMRRYKVSFDDCCVAGHFTAVLINLDADDEFVYNLAFDNGVVLTECGGVTLEPV